MNRHILLSLTFIFMLAGCQQATSTAQTQLPPPAIDVAHVAYEDVQAWHTFTTRLEAPQQVTVMPRVSGMVDRISFKEGQRVAEGDLLVQIDARPFAAQVARLEAEIESAKAALNQAKNKEKRALSLGSSRAISEEEIEARSADTQQRAATLQALEAQLVAARLDLAFTQVRSPIDGVISSAFITRGNNVTANVSVLTNIVSDDKMYAYFEVDERTWNREYGFIRGNSKAPAVLTLSGSRENVMGVIDFIDNRVDATTGTLRVRAVFDAYEDQLKPGAFARIKLATAQQGKQILIPEKAIGTDLKNRFVLTLNEQNQLQYKQVEVGQRYGTFRVIEDGLSPDDRIAVNGPARVGPGMTVSPVDVDLDISTTQLTLLDSVEQSALSAQL